MSDWTTVRLAKELVARLSKDKKPYETWSGYLNRVIPEKK